MRKPIYPLSEESFIECGKLYAERHNSEFTELDREFAISLHRLCSVSYKRGLQGKGFSFSKVSDEDSDDFWDALKDYVYGAWECGRDEAATMAQ